WREFRARQRAYAARHARDLLRRGVRPRPWTYLTQPAREFRRRYATLGAWRDGALGLALSAWLAYYEAIAHVELARLWRRGRAASAATRASCCGAAWSRSCARWTAAGWPGRRSSSTTPRPTGPRRWSARTSRTCDWSRAAATAASRRATTSAFGSRAGGRSSC